MQDQREKVEGDEDDCDRLGSKPRQLATEDGDDPRETQVDGCREECRTDRKSYKVYDEVVVIQDIVIEHDTSDVADKLQSDASDHGYEVAPGTVFDPETDLSEHATDEESQEQCVASQAGHICQLAIVIETPLKLRALR